MPSPEQDKTERKNQNFFMGLLSRVLDVSKRTTYRGARDLPNALGYNEQRGFDNFRDKYQRHWMAKAAISRIVSATFRGGLELVVPATENREDLEKQWDELDKRLVLQDLLARFDTLTMLGQYGGMLLGFDDVQTEAELMNPVRSGDRKLLYLRPLGQDKMKMAALDENPSSERYGMPILYDVTVTPPTMTGTMMSQPSMRRVRTYEHGTSRTVSVHHERIIHVAYDTLDDDLVGVPFLDAIYDRLDDLDKLVGGSAEMFWRGARPGYQGKVSENYHWDEEMEEEMRKQLDQIEHDLRRFVVTEGVEYVPLAQQVADPEGHFKVQVQAVAAATNIPQRILLGSERGELASSEDRNNWFELISSRRQYVADKMVRKLVDRLIAYGVLAAPPIENEYVVKWADLFTMSDKQKAEIGKTKSEIIKNYVSQPSSPDVVPVAIWAREVLDFRESVVKEIEENFSGMIAREQQDANPGTN